MNIFLCKRIDKSAKLFIKSRVGSKESSSPARILWWKVESKVAAQYTSPKLHNIQPISQSIFYIFVFVAAGVANCSWN